MDKLLLGVDGGGTKTIARISAYDGQILGTGLAGPSALAVGVPNAIEAILQACNSAADQAGISSSEFGNLFACMGLSSTERPELAAELRSWSHPFAELTVTSDAETACIGAHSGDDGGVVIAGTGSIGFVRKGGKSCRYGGYGFPISDAGSGARMGLAAAQAAMHSIDDPQWKSQLCTAILSEVGSDYSSAMSNLGTGSAARFAALAPLVLSHANQGDSIARRIVSQCAADLDTMIQAVYRLSGSRICLLGGIAPPIAPYLSSSSHSKLIPARGDALDGAIHFARLVADKRRST